MRSISRLAAPLLVLAGLLAAPAVAGAAGNPYTAVGVCGPGFKVIDRQPLVDSNWNRLLSEVVLTYNAGTGQNCVVNLKRYRVGKAVSGGDWMYAELYTKPLRNPANTQSNQGDFKFYAGPVYVTARGKCVQWGGGAQLLVPSNWEPNGGKFNSAFRSPFSGPRAHCG